MDGQDSNPRPSAPDPSALTTRLQRPQYNDFDHICGTKLCKFRHCCIIETLSNYDFYQRQNQNESVHRFKMCFAILVMYNVQK